MDAKTNIQRLRIQSIFAASAGVLMLGAFFSTAVHASQFGVQVVDESGVPVVGASVCFGLPGNYSQFGALFTDKEGQAIVDVPNVPFVITVSKTRFSGTRISEPARGFNLVKQVKLIEGIPGPRCRAGSSLADLSHSSIEITNVAVDVVAGRTTVLMPEAKGEPTEYRLSSSETFESEPWVRLEKQIALPGALAENDSVFLQLRRFQGKRNSWVEARSAVVTVYLPTVR